MTPMTLCSVLCAFYLLTHMEYSDGERPGSVALGIGPRQVPDMVSSRRLQSCTSLSAECIRCRVSSKGSSRQFASHATVELGSCAKLCACFGCFMSLSRLLEEFISSRACMAASGLGWATTYQPQENSRDMIREGFRKHERLSSCSDQDTSTLATEFCDNEGPSLNIVTKHRTSVNDHHRPR